jgi:hypothetical protein
VSARQEHNLAEQSHGGRIVSLLLLGAALIGLGELIRKWDDNLADFPD